MAIITADELAAYLNGVTWNPVQLQHINAFVLPGVQQELETYLNRPVEPLHVREPRQVDCNGRIWPTVTPVWRVLSIDQTPMGGEVVTPDDYTPPALGVVVETVREWDPAGTKMKAPNWLAQGGLAGSNYILLPNWTPEQYPFQPSGYAVVDYIGGYNGYVDNALKLGIMRVAAREVERLYDNAITLRDGAGQPTEYSDTRPKGWTPEELAQFDRIRRRVVV